MGSILFYTLVVLVILHLFTGLLLALGYLAGWFR